MSSSIGKKCCPMLLLLRLLVQVVCSAASSLPTFTFQPAVLNELAEGKNATVSFKMDVPEAYLKPYEKQGPWRVELSPIHESIASVSSDEHLFSKNDLIYDNSTRFYTLHSNFTVNGKFLGKTGIRARFVLAKWDEYPGEDIRENTLDVAVKRGESGVLLTKIFVSSLVVVISIANVLMGCELDMNVVKEVLKRPVGPSIGFFTQFLVMPLLAYAIAHTVFTPKGLHSFALGLFVTGCSPGGGASNFWTLLLDGNVNLSVTMTFLSTLGSLVMMPLWLTLLGQDFLQGFGAGVRMRVPYSKIMSSLFSLVVPLMIGVGIAKWKPELAAKGRKMLRPFVIFVLVFVIVFGCIANTYMWRIMTPTALLGGLLLPWCGFMCGCFISIAMGRSPADVTAIAVETGIQNTGIAILMLKWSFPEPDADISALIPVIVACFTPGPLMLGAAIHTLSKRLKRRSEGLSLGKELNELPEKPSLEPAGVSYIPNQDEMHFIDRAHEGQEV
ncbi:unnamed protein product, partial [Mesorhabditis spiculigera]